MVEGDSQAIRAAIGVADWCDSKTAELIPQIGQDEGKPRGSYNKEAREVVAQLVRNLAKVNWGDYAAEIRIGKVATAREAIGVLTTWKKKLLAQIEVQRRAEKRDAKGKVDGNAFESNPEYVPTGLSATQAKAYAIIRDQGPIAGKVLAKRLSVSESTLRRHVVPKLRRHGIKNDRAGEGYYLPSQM